MLYPPYNETYGKGVYDEILAMGFGTLGNGGVTKKLFTPLATLPCCHCHAAGLCSTFSSHAMSPWHSQGENFIQESSAYGFAASCFRPGTGDPVEQPHVCNRCLRMVSLHCSVSHILMSIWAHASRGLMHL